MSSQKHNVLFITSDQHHWKALGYLNPEISTPNLDRLVKRGVTFHRAYTVNPSRNTDTGRRWYGEMGKALLPMPRVAGA